MKTLCKQKFSEEILRYIKTGQLLEAQSVFKEVDRLLWCLKFSTVFIRTDHLTASLGHLHPIYNLEHYLFKIKNGKAVPLQAWSGPEGSRKLRFPDFMTTAQDGGKVVSLTRRPPLPP